MFSQRLLTTLAAIILAAFVFKQGYEAWKWKKNVDERGWRADQAFLYLAVPMGRDLTRAQVLDYVSQQVIKQQAEAGKK